MLLLLDAQRIEQFTPAEVSARAVVGKRRQRLKNIETPHLRSIVAFNSPDRDEYFALHAKPLFNGIEHRTVVREQALAGHNAFWRKRRSQIVPNRFDKFGLLKIEGLDTRISDNARRGAVIKLRIDAGPNCSRPEPGDEVPKFGIGILPDRIQ